MKEEKINGYLFLFNLEEFSTYEEVNFDKVPAIDFYKILKGHFGELDENGFHKTIVRNTYKIYFHWTGKLEKGIELTWAGKNALIEIMNLARAKNMVITVPYQRELINLFRLEKHGFKDLDDFLLRRDS